MKPSYSPSAIGKSGTGWQKIKQQHLVAEHDRKQAAKRSSQELTGQFQEEKRRRNLARRAAQKIRWGYFLPRAVLALIVGVAIQFGFEPLLQFGITSGLSQVFQATTTIQTLQSQFFDSELQIENLEVGAENASGPLLKVDRIHVDWDRDAMLRKKCVVDVAEIEGFVWNKNYESQQASSDRDKTQSEWTPVLKQQADFIKEQARVAAANLWDQLVNNGKGAELARTLETVRLAEAKHEIWKTRFDNYREEADATKQKLESLKEEIELVKKAGGLEQIERLAKLSGQVKVMAIRSRELRGELEMLPRQARIDLAELNEARQRDEAVLRRGVEAIPTSPEELTMMLIGPEAVKQLQEIASWIPMIEQVVTVLTDDYRPERTTGREIVFDRHPETPRMLFHKILVSGTVLDRDSSQRLTGELLNLTSAPKTYAKPVEYQFAAAGEKAWKGKGWIDLRGDEVKQHLSGMLASKLPQRVELLKHDRIQLTGLSSGSTAQVEIDMQGSQLELVCHWQQAETHFNVEGDLEWLAPAALASRVSPVQPLQTVEKTLNSLPEFSGELRVSGSWKKPSIQIQSPVGSLVSKQLNHVMKDELQQRTNEAVELARTEINGKVAEFQQQIDAESQKLVQLVAGHEQTAARMIERVAARPAQDLFKRFIR